MIALTVVNGEVEVDVTFHAVERFRERVRPGLDGDQLLAAICEFARVASISPFREDWLGPGSKAVAWLSLGDVAFPLIADSRLGRLVAPTCLAANRGSMRTRPCRRDIRAANRRRSWFDRYGEMAA